MSVKFPTPFDIEIGDDCLESTESKEYISITIQPKTPVYILKGYEIFDTHSNDFDISKRFTPYLTKKEITTEAWEVSRDLRFQKTFIVDLNTIFKSSQLLMLKMEGYSIIVDKQFVHFNTTSKVKVYKHQINKDRYFFIEYKDTIESDIQLFCNSYDIFDSYKDRSDKNDNNSYIKTIYSNRIISCILKGPKGKTIQTIM